MSTGDAHHHSYITVSDGRFIKDGKEFRFLGVNSYFLMTWAADCGLRGDCLNVLDAVKVSGMKVIRTWAFNDGPDQWKSLQPSPGRIEDEVAEGLDWLVAECGKRGLVLVLTLTNYWTEYGGMHQYMKWSPTVSNASDKDDASPFYTDKWCQDAFLFFIDVLLNRRNTVTGLLYKEDPTIMAWELANEPRCKNDTTGETLARWINSTAMAIKRTDTRHLVTCGLEGFFNQRSPEAIHNPCSWFGSIGCDFASDCYCQQQPSESSNNLHSDDGLSNARHMHAASSHQDGTGLDFAMVHAYPDQWCKLSVEECTARIEWTVNWVASHSGCCHHLNIPLVLGELGAPGSDDDQSRFFAEVLGKLEQDKTLAGTLVWVLVPRAFPSTEYAIIAEDLLDAGAKNKTCQVLRKYASRASTALSVQSS